MKEIERTFGVNLGQNNQASEQSAAGMATGNPIPSGVRGLPKQNYVSYNDPFANSSKPPIIPASKVTPKPRSVAGQAGQ
jgi:hypothetical protein